jgi:hypothetical protein
MTLTVFTGYGRRFISAITSHMQNNRLCIDDRYDASAWLSPAGLLTRYASGIISSSPAGRYGGRSLKLTPPPTLAKSTGTNIAAQEKADTSL